MYPLELEAAILGADELDEVDAAILEEDDLCSRNPGTPAQFPADYLSTILCVHGPVL